MRLVSVCLVAFSSLVYAWPYEIVCTDDLLFQIILKDDWGQCFVYDVECFDVINGERPQINKSAIVRCQDNARIFHYYLWIDTTNMTVKVPIFPHTGLDCQKKEGRQKRGSIIDFDSLKRPLTEGYQDLIKYEYIQGVNHQTGDRLTKEDRFTIK